MLWPLVTFPAQAYTPFCRFWICPAKWLPDAGRCQIRHWGMRVRGCQSINSTHDGVQERKKNTLIKKQPKLLWVEPPTFRFQVECSTIELKSWESLTYAIKISQRSEPIFSRYVHAIPRCNWNELKLGKSIQRIHVTPLSRLSWAHIWWPPLRSHFKILLNTRQILSCPTAYPSSSLTTPHQPRLRPLARVIGLSQSLPQGFGTRHYLQTSDHLPKSPPFKCSPKTLPSSIPPKSSSRSFPLVQSGEPAVWEGLGPQKPLYKNYYRYYAIAIRLELPECKCSPPKKSRQPRWPMASTFIRKKKREISVRRWTKMGWRLQFPNSFRIPSTVWPRVNCLRDGLTNVLFWSERTSSPPLSPPPQIGGFPSN